MNDTDLPEVRALAAFTRQLVAGHDDWDSLHAFVTLYWDGEQITCGTWVAVDTAIDSRDYPALMAQTAAEEVAKLPGGAPPPYAYALQVEAHSATRPPAGAPAAERERFEADRLARAFHARPDAVEKCLAYCVDVERRLYAAEKRRDRPEEITEIFRAAGSPRRPRGGVVAGLFAVAEWTRKLAVAGGGVL